MENMMAYINIGTSVMLSVILFMAGVAKISDLVYTEQVIRKFAFLPKEIAPLIKVSLPVVEITIAIALLFPFQGFIASGGDNHCDSIAFPFQRGLCHPRVGYTFCDVRNCANYCFFPRQRYSMWLLWSI
jgi:hypothetical protein